jgi:hypothetical protein
MIAVRALRLLLVIVYASYLTNVGMLLVMLPWSEVWPRFVLLLPPAIGIVVDDPAVRGAVTAFGCLHLVLLLVEIVRSPTTFAGSQREPSS